MLKKWLPRISAFVLLWAMVFQHGVPNARAAIAFDAANASQYPATTVALTIAATDPVVLVKFMTNGSSSVTSVLVGATAMTLVKKYTNTTGGNPGTDHYVYALAAPPTGAQTITVNVDQAIFYIQAISLTGADQTTQPDATNNGGEGSGSAGSGSVTTVADNSVGVMFIEYDNNGTAVSAGSDTALGHDFNQTNNTLRAGVLYSTSAVTPAGATTLNSDGHNTSWSQITVSVKPAAVAVADSPRSHSGRRAVMIQ